MKMREMVWMHTCTGGCDDHFDEHGGNNDCADYDAASSGSNASNTATSRDVEDIMYHNRIHKQQQGTSHRRPLPDSASLSSYCCLYRNFLSFFSNSSSGSSSITSSNLYTQLFTACR
jgi:hypothetical protein